MNEKTTHFGYQQVPYEQKVERVGRVFSSVAEQYDLMNDLMSFGLHRIWKRLAIMHLNLRSGHQVLDLAGGTGDLTEKIHHAIGTTGQVVLCDINEQMLQQGKNRLLDKGIFHNVTTQIGNAEHLPFADASFDRVIIGFGLRNVTNKEQALKDIYRVLVPSGQLIILEFSQPTHEILQKLYDAYSMNIIPKLGKLVTQDPDSYRYLVESIRMHPNQETLTTMIRSAGFDHAEHCNLTGGIVAIHKGTKY